jgi:hypothetical protein
VVAVINIRTVHQFFEHYRDAFNALKADAVATLWDTPSGIAQSGQMHWWPEAAPMRENMHALCEVYRQAGYGHAEFELLTVHPLGPQFFWADVQWTVWRKDGSVLQRFRTAYQLVQRPQGLKVLICMAYEENLGAMRSGPTT